MLLYLAMLLLEPLYITLYLFCFSFVFLVSIYFVFVSVVYCLYLYLYFYVVATVCTFSLFGNIDVKQFFEPEYG